MDPSMWIWVVVIVVVLVILGFLVSIGLKRRRAAQQLQANENRERAARLRDEAQDADLAAREQHVAASRKAADAEQTAVEAERLSIEAERQRSRAAAEAARSKDRLSQAAALDPDYQTRNRAGANHESDTAGMTSVDGHVDGGNNHENATAVSEPNDSAPNVDTTVANATENRHGRRRGTP